VAEIRKSRLPGATFKIRKFPLSPPIEPNLTPKSYLKKKNVRFAQSRYRLRRSALVLSLSAPEASEGSLDAVSGCETGVSNPKLTRKSQISPQIVCFPNSLDLIRAYIITISPHLDIPFFWVIWSFRLQVAPGSVQLRPRRSQEVRGSPQLQNGGLRALEEAWMTTFRLRHSSVMSGRFQCFSGVSRWLQEVSSCVQGGPRRSGDAHNSRTVG